MAKTREAKKFQLDGKSLEWPVFPLLFAVFPILSLFDHNIDEVELSYLSVPLFLALTISIAFGLFFFFIFRNWTNASLMVSLLIGIFFLHHPVHNLLGENFLFGTDKLLFLVWFSLILGLFFFLLRKETNLKGISKPLNVFAGVLVLIPLLNISVYESDRSTFTSGNFPGEIAVAASSSDQERPDIYYLVFEEYDSQRTLQDYYKFDNSDILKFLEGKGFYITEDSKTNYPSTDLSVASSLNLDYINYLQDQTNGGNISDRTVLHPLIEDNRVVSFLKQQGYKYYHMGSWWEQTKKNKNADENFPSDNFFFNRHGFSTEILKTTLTVPIVARFFPESDLAKVVVNADLSHRDRILDQVETVKNIPELPGPKFVFIHVMAPHKAYVFDSDCRQLSEKEKLEQEELEGYLDQLQCVNRFIKDSVTEILAKSKNPPVIIVQGDEGEFPMKNIPTKDQIWGRATRDQLKEKFGIINALYLPGVDKSTIRPNVSPVNVFRIVFNQYFKTNYEILPDRYFAPDAPERFYNFVDVTERLKD